MKVFSESLKHVLRGVELIRVCGGIARLKNALSESICMSLDEGHLGGFSLKMIIVNSELVDHRDEPVFCFRSDTISEFIRRVNLTRETLHDWI